MAKLKTTWECWIYDVVGNAKDGYDVNDCSCFARNAALTLTVKVCNAGTPQAFESAHPTDRQIRRLFGLTCKFETDGDDTTVYITRVRDGYPIGEMFCTSHESLSPIRARVGEQNAQASNAERVPSMSREAPARV